MRDYSKMFDDPESLAKERKARMKFYSLTIQRVTQKAVQSGGQQVFTTQRHMKHKTFVIQGKHVK